MNKLHTGIDLVVISYRIGYKPFGSKDTKYASTNFYQIGNNLFLSNNFSLAYHHQIVMLDITKGNIYRYIHTYSVW